MIFLLAGTKFKIINCKASQGYKHLNQKSQESKVKSTISQQNIQIRRMPQIHQKANTFYREECQNSGKPILKEQILLQQGMPTLNVIQGGIITGVFQQHFSFLKSLPHLKLSKKRLVSAKQACSKKNFMRTRPYCFKCL